MRQQAIPDVAVGDTPDREVASELARCYKTFCAPERDEIVRRVVDGEPNDQHANEGPGESALGWNWCCRPSRGRGAAVRAQPMVAMPFCELGGSAPDREVKDTLTPGERRRFDQRAAEDIEQPQHR
jgi:hypothetical protein